MNFYMAPRVWAVDFFGFALIVLETVSSRREDKSSLCFLSKLCLSGSALCFSVSKSWLMI